MEQLEQIKQIAQQLIEAIGFNDSSVTFDAEGKRLSILISEDNLLQKRLPNFVLDFTHVFKLISKKNNWPAIIVDVNNYRKERQNLIVELAKAAARKASSEKTEIALPPMNAFERRLVHMELAGRPDLKTESIGAGKERSVIVKPILI